MKPDYTLQKHTNGKKVDVGIYELKVYKSQNYFVSLLYFL